MNMAVYYKKRHYGTGGDVRHYSVVLSEVNGLFVDRISPSSKHYHTREMELYFPFRPSVGGIGDNPWSEAEVGAGSLTLSYDAARQLANAIMKFVDEKKRTGRPGRLEIEIAENPDPE